MKRLILGLVATITMLAGTVAGAQPASAVPLCNPGGSSNGYELVLRCSNSYPGLQWEVKVYCPGESGHRESAWRSSSDQITMRCNGIRYVGYATRWV